MAALKLEAKTGQTSYKYRKDRSTNQTYIQQINIPLYIYTYI